MQLRHHPREAWQWRALLCELDAYVGSLLSLAAQLDDDDVTSNMEDAMSKWISVLSAREHGQDVFGFVLAIMARHSGRFSSLLRRFVPGGEKAEARLFSRIEIMKRACYPFFCE